MGKATGELYSSADPGKTGDRLASSFMDYAYTVFGLGLLAGCLC
jgi:hypothetical protein